MAIDYSSLFQPVPQSPTARGLTHLSSVLDAIMERRSQEERQRIQLEQQARLAAVDDARLQLQADQQAHHATVEEEIAKAKNEQDAQDKEVARRQAAMPHIQENLDTGNEAGARMWGQGAGVDIAPTAPTIPMNLLDAVQPQAAPADPLGPPPAPNMGGEEGAIGGRPSGTQTPPPPIHPMQAMTEAPPPPAPRTWDITAGGQAPITYDPGANRRTALERGGQLAGDLGAISAGGKSPFEARALTAVEAMAKTGALKTQDEALKTYNDLAKFYELQDAENKRAAMAAAAQRDKSSLTHPVGERDVPTFEGGKAGVAASKEDAEAAKKKRATLRPIISQLDSMDKLVGSMGWMERAPIVGGFTEKQQRARGMLDTMIAPITQALGSGTPQEAEARRKLETLTASMGQGPDIARKNIAQLQAYLRDSYEQEVGSIVPGYQPHGVAKPNAADIAAKWRARKGGQ